jgi:hypothetical protein
MGYVYSTELGSVNGVFFSLDIFKESNTEYRPIVTANSDNGMGCSKRRSFPSETEAKEFFQNNQDQLTVEALRDIK